MLIYIYIYRCIYISLYTYVDRYRYTNVCALYVYTYIYIYILRGDRLSSYAWYSRVQYRSTVVGQYTSSTGVVEYYSK